MIGIGRPDTPGMSSSTPAEIHTRGPQGRYNTSEQLGFMIGVSATVAQVLLVPQGGIYVVTCIEVFNRDTVQQTVTFRVIPPNQVMTDATYDFDDVVCGGRSKVLRIFDQAYPAGYILAAIATAPDLVNVRVHGMNLVQQ